MKKRIFNNFSSGVTTPVLLIILGTMLIIIYGLLIMLGLQMEYSHRQVASEQALNIAEAGINYYRWHLAHAPEDLRDGTTEDGPYEHDYYDPQGAKIGKYSLEIIPPDSGSGIIQIISTGWTEQYPQVKRKIKAQYGKPSLTQYSFLTNASSWYGSGTIVNGRIHSNNGIRMDGINTSLITSSQNTYMCGSETGCHPPENKPGIWGSGPGGSQGLWQFPRSQYDFDTISFNFSLMQEAAQTSGLFLEPSGKSGYHIIFLSDGSYRVNRVTRTDYYEGYSVPGQGHGQEGIGGCRRLYQRIINESNIGTYSISQKPIIFVEDDLWVEGTINGRVTIVAASFPIASSSENIWIPNNLVYSDYNGNNALGLIAEGDIYFTRNIPDDFRVDGALIAQSGKIIRHGYLPECGNSDQAVKNRLTINGSLISYYKSYWNFGNEPLSGFRERIINFDSHLFYNPPPYFPSQGDYELMSWSEE